jgi:hypothetical protein
VEFPVMRGHAWQGILSCAPAMTGRDNDTGFVGVSEGFHVIQ